MHVGSLCTGIGGLDLGLELSGMKIIWQAEINEHCCSVLKRHWPDVPNHGNVTEISAEQLAPVDLLCGGYPCQPFSHAGKRKGAGDDRHLWPEFIRIIRDLRGLGRLPSWCLFENVAGHISLGLDSVLSDLEGVGYACWPLVIPSCSLGARHQRDRVWIVAHAERHGSEGRPAFSAGWGGQSFEEQLARLLFPCSWPSLSVARAYGTNNGVPKQVDRNKALGNAVFPKLAAVIGMAIRCAEEMKNPSVLGAEGCKGR